jgi:hypothetical protein
MTPLSHTWPGSESHSHIRGHRRLNNSVRWMTKYENMLNKFWKDLMPSYLVTWQRDPTPHYEPSPPQKRPV